jgi:hypothetical protein
MPSESFAYIHASIYVVGLIFRQFFMNITQTDANLNLFFLSFIKIMLPTRRKSVALGGSHNIATTGVVESDPET